MESEFTPKASNRGAARRAAILAVARDVFFEDGFEGASMSTIAARLGGSKGTLYNYFPGKEALFEALVRAQCARFADGMFDLPQGRPVREVLARLGERYLEHLLSDWAVRTFQIIVAEARRSPELARLFYEVGPAVGVDRFARYLEGARAAGLVDAPDCRLAASQFMSLCRGHRHVATVLNLETRPSPEVLAAEVAEAVALFMARYESSSA